MRSNDAGLNRIRFCPIGTRYSFLMDSLAHSPYIMPDGNPPNRRDLSVKKSRGFRVVRGSSITGKQSQADLVSGLTARARLHDGERNQAELAELRALETVGVRRRRRWLNEKQLRDAAGPMSAADMQSLFHPAPFGSTRESPLTQLRDNPAAAAVFESFRTIDPDKQTRVLEKWEEYNKSLRSASSACTTGLPGTPTSLALRQWSTVSKAARTALRRAKISTVLALESLILDAIEQDDHQSPTVIEPSDAFGRMLVHGLAQFHGLVSSTRTINSAVTVTTSSQPHDRNDYSRISCVDILLAMAEVGESGLNHNTLEAHLSRAGLHPADSPGLLKLEKSLDSHE